VYFVCFVVFGGKRKAVLSFLAWGGFFMPEKKGLPLPSDLDIF